MTQIEKVTNALDELSIEYKMITHPPVCTIEEMDEMGIFTDGDLRRSMSPDLLEKEIRQVMTYNPKTISPDVFAAEALYQMNTTGKGITSLFAVDENHKPMGLIHVHDCLRAGVA